MKIGNSSYNNSCFETRTRLLFVIVSFDTNERCKSSFSRPSRPARWCNIFTMVWSMVLEKHPSDMELHYECSTPTSQELSSPIFQSCGSGSVTFNQISTLLSGPCPIIVFACQWLTDLLTESRTCWKLNELSERSIESYGFRGWKATIGAMESILERNPFDWGEGGNGCQY